MADVKISELPALTTPDGAEELVVNASGTTKKITIDNLFNQDIDVTGTVTADGLVVDSSGAATTFVEFKNSTGSGKFDIKQGGANNTIVRGYNSSNAETIRLDPTSDTFFNGGNVGIGTSSPSGLAKTLNIDGGSSGASVALDGGANFAVMYTGATAGDPTSIFSNTGFKFATATSKAAAGFAERMRIDSSGKTTFKGEIDLATGANKKISWRDADDTFRAGIQAVTSGGQMIATSSANDFALRSQSNMLFSAGGNIERMRIDAAGRVTKPYQPSFKVHQNNQTVSASGLHTVSFSDTETYAFDNGNNFSSNIFTAPVAGKYFFAASLRIDGLNDYFRIIITQNNRSDYSTDIHAIYNPNSSVNFHTLAVSGILNLAANDTVRVKVNGVNDSSWISQGEGTFSGYLLG